MLPLLALLHRPPVMQPDGWHKEKDRLEARRQKQADKHNQIYHRTATVTCRRRSVQPNTNSCYAIMQPLTLSNQTQPTEMIMQRSDKRQKRQDGIDPQLYNK